MTRVLCTYAATETAICGLKDGLGMLRWFTVFFAVTETAMCGKKDGLGTRRWLTVFFKSVLEVIEYRCYMFFVLMQLRTQRYVA